jgi:predicted Rossmann fold nucleotide-binding protein DprA/Smf involved in DNA uptake
MDIAIIGSRRYTNRDRVEKLISSINPKHTIISGGCRGVDTWAVEAAKKHGMATKIIRPQLENKRNYYEIINGYYQRNREIALMADCIFAFPAPDRKGGTENTLKYAKQFKKPVFIYN